MIGKIKAAFGDQFSKSYHNVSLIIDVFANG